MAIFLKAAFWGMIWAAVAIPSSIVMAQNFGSEPTDFLVAMFSGGLLTSVLGKFSRGD
jgi:MFS superfamily sulfate permease-like transporter